MRLTWPQRRLPRASNASGSSTFAESTMAQLAWQRKRQAVARWAWAGLASGALVGIVAFAPATWLAAAVARATNERFLLADARGTVWNGSAIAVLTGGPDSRSAAALPERLNWSIALRTSGLALSLNQSCCMSAPLVLQLRPGLGRLSVSLLPGAGSLGEWPAAWLTGLGAPWNTLQLGGTLRLASPGIGLHLGDGGWRLEGQATLELNNASSRVATLDRLGSYSLVVDGKGANTANLLLRTLDGSLLMSGTGGWTDGRLRFRGEARAAPGLESALDNLLNILGRRQGALSVISIGSP